MQITIFWLWLWHSRNIWWAISRNLSVLYHLDLEDESKGRALIFEFSETPRFSSQFLFSLDVWYTLIKRPLCHTWMIIIHKNVSLQLKIQRQHQPDPVCLCGASSMWGITRSLVTTTLDIWQAELHQYLLDLFLDILAAFQSRLLAVHVTQDCWLFHWLNLYYFHLFPTYIHPTSPCITLLHFCHTVHILSGHTASTPMFRFTPGSYLGEFPVPRNLLCKSRFLMFFFVWNFQNSSMLLRIQNSFFLCVFITTQKIIQNIIKHLKRFLSQT